MFGRYLWDSMYIGNICNMVYFGYQIAEIFKLQFSKIEVDLFNGINFNIV